MLLGRMLETEFLRSYQLSGGNPLYILERPGALGILAVMIVTFGLTAWSKHKEREEELRAAALISERPA
jgi:putative tricarboxylic transport membrane protein